MLAATQNCTRIIKKNMQPGNIFSNTSSESDKKHREAGNYHNRKMQNVSFQLILHATGNQ